MSWCCICPYLSWKLITNNVLVSMGCRLFIFSNSFWILRVYLPFLHRPIKAMGDIFQWVVRFQPLPNHEYSSVYFFSGRCQKKKKQQQQLVHSLKCWQLNPKIYPKDFIDFWFNCARLLNHVKVTLSKPFTHGMKSVVNKIIGPMPLLCRCLPFCCVIASGQQQRLIGVDKRCFPRIMSGSKKNMKKWKKKATTNRKKHFKRIHKGLIGVS